MSTPKPNRSCKFQETKTCLHKLDHEAYLNSTGFLRTFTIPLEAGYSIGHPSEWSLFFVNCGSQSTSTTTLVQKKSCDDMDFIGVFLNSVQQPASDSSILSEIYDHQECEFIVRCSVKVFDGLDESGNSVTREIESYPITSFEKGCWCWKKVPSIPYLQLFDQNKNKSLQEEDKKHLELLITFSLVAQSKYTLEKVPSSCLKLMVQKQTTEKEIGQNLFDFIHSGSSCEPDVVIESTFGKVYHVHQQVLAGRSPVFDAMFGTSMIEKTTGHVKLEDTSSEALEFLLRHIYTGQAEKEWLESPKIATELVYSAEKYWLTSLTAFCDKNLIQAANRRNCLSLLELASLHDLNYACDELTKFVHDKMEVNGKMLLAQSSAVDNEEKDCGPSGIKFTSDSSNANPTPTLLQQEDDSNDNEDNKPSLGFSITVVQNE